MAHIFDIAASMAPYTSGRRTEGGNLPVRFPDTPVFRGMNRPSRFEGDVLDLEVSGVIPDDIDGTFYRVQPDTRFPPLFEDDIHFNGDGSVTAIRIHGGGAAQTTTGAGGGGDKEGGEGGEGKQQHADLKQRYVHTERYKLETAARRALFGRYRNPYTDSETVRGVIRTASNTNVIFWRGMLLATKEDGPPYAMDPTTLETLGRYDFEGQITAPTFTAHPKFDPDTGEMVCFAYEAGGNGSDCSKAVVVWTFDADGRKQSEDWYEAPYAGMIHDCGLSKNWLVLPLTPIKMNLERMKRGGNKFAWDPNESQYYALVPRRRQKGVDGHDIKWFKADNGFQGHVAGCYELDDGRVVVDLTVADGNVFFWFPPDPDADDAAPPANGHDGTNGAPNGNGATPPTAKAGEPASLKPPVLPPPGQGGITKRNALSSPTCRWILDPSAPDRSHISPAVAWPTNGEFSRIDDRFVTRPYTHFWQAKVDPTREYDMARCGPPAGGLFNCLGHCVWDGADPLKPGTEEVAWAGPRATFQEPTFIPRRAARPGEPDRDVPEGDGYLIALVNRLDELRNDVAIFDAQALAKGPLAVIHLPVKLKLGLHGNWVDRRELEAWEARRSAEPKDGVDGFLGPVKVATEPLPWQVKESS